MPLPLATLADIFISALAHVRAERGNVNPTQLAARLQARFGRNDPTDFFSFYNQVRNAIRSYNAARSTFDEPERIPTQREHPVDPSATESGFGYAYRVVIVVNPRDGSEKVETLVVVYSNERLSPDDIRDRAARMYSERNWQRKSDEKMRRVGPEADLTFHIVGIGRAGE